MPVSLNMEHMDMPATNSDLEKEAYRIYKKKLEYGIPEGPLNNSERNWKEAQEKLKARRLEDLYSRGTVGT